MRNKLLLNVLVWFAIVVGLCSCDPRPEQEGTYPSTKNNNKYAEVDAEIARALHALNAEDKKNKAKIAEAINYYIWRNYKRSANASGSDPVDIINAKDAQCQGRVILASWLLDRLDIKSRMVFINNIGGGAHSVIEVDVGGKYVLFDPLNGGYFTENGEINNRKLALAELLADPGKYTANLIVPCDSDQNIITGGVPNNIKLPSQIRDASGFYCRDREGVAALGINKNTLQTISGNDYYYQASLIKGKWYPIDYAVDVINFTNKEKKIGIVEQTHSALDYDELRYASRNICNIDTQKSIKVINYPAETQKVVLSLSTVPPKNYVFGYRQIGSFSKIKHAHPSGQNLEITIDNNSPGSVFIYPDMSLSSTCIFIDSIYIE